MKIFIAFNLIFSIMIFFTLCLYINLNDINIFNHIHHKDNINHEYSRYIISMICSSLFGVKFIASFYLLLDPPKNKSIQLDNYIILTIIISLLLLSSLMITLLKNTIMIKTLIPIYFISCCQLFLVENYYYWNKINIY